MDFAIIHGTNLSFQDKIEEKNISKWIEKMEVAFLDIKMIYQNNDNLQAYYFTKQKFLCSVLFKMLSTDQENESVADNFEPWLAIIPEISWETLFLLIYKIGMVSELINICSKISDNFRVKILGELKVLLKNMFDENLAHKSHLNSIDLLCILCVINYEMCFVDEMEKNGEFFDMLKTLSKSFDFGKDSEIAVKCVTECISCKRKSMFDPSFYRINKLQQSLKSFNVDNPYGICKSLSENEYKITTNDIKLVSESKHTFKCEFFELLKTITKKLNSTKLNQILQDLLQVEESTNEILANNCVKYGLKGYTKIASEILHNLENESLDKMTVGIDVLLQNPNSIATVDKVYFLLSTLQKIETKLSTDCLQNVWNLFTESFACLNLKGKILLLEKIVDSQLLTYLDTNKDTEDSRKVINAFLNQLDTYDVTKEQLSEICCLFVQSPKILLEKLISQSVNNPQQQSCLLNVFSKLPFLFGGKFASNKYSHFHSKFFEMVNEFYARNEQTEVENAVKFLEKVLMNENCPITMFKDLIDTIMDSIFSSLKYEIDGPILPLELALKTIIMTQNLKPLSTICQFEDAVLLCCQIANLFELNMQEWLHAFTLNNVQCISLLEEITFLLIPDLCEYFANVSAKEDKFESQIQWLEHQISSLNWTTQVYFYKLFQFFTESKIKIPECIKDVCGIVEKSYLLPAPELSYGEGTGLLAWLQCFSIAPSICPLSTLNVYSCTFSELALFERGWTITMSQLLPFLTPLQIKTLVNASRVLIMEEVLFIKFESTANEIPLLLDLNQCRVPLSLLQLLGNINAILFSNCSSKWTTKNLVFYHIKHFCQTVSSIIAEHPEYNNAGMFERLFILSQAFEYVLQALNMVMKMHVQTNQAVDFLFMLALDLLSNFEQSMVTHDTTTGDSLSSDTDKNSESTEHFELESTYSSMSKSFLFSSLVDFIQNNVQTINETSITNSLNKKIESICETIKGIE